jgi:hypothetical protein
MKKKLLFFILFLTVPQNCSEKPKILVADYLCHLLLQRGDSFKEYCYLAKEYHKNPCFVPTYSQRCHCTLSVDHSPLRDSNSVYYLSKLDKPLEEINFQDECTALAAIKNQARADGHNKLAEFINENAPNLFN